MKEVESLTTGHWHRVTLLYAAHVLS
jgi:hypothetical protein